SRLRNGHRDPRTSQRKSLSLYRVPQHCCRGKGCMGTGGRRV
ncbi:uncharacterized protein METZ01_LOCUS351520, partial [marine metagenome]